MKFTERALLLIISELGLEIRSVKAFTERVNRPLRALLGILTRAVNFTRGMGRKGIDFSTSHYVLRSK